MIWAKLTAELVGKPFKEGATGPDAYDCFGLMVKVQRKMGWKMPKEFEGWDLTNYAQRFNENPDEGIAVLTRLLDANCKRVDDAFLKRGDVLLVKENRHGQVFPAIYAGKRDILTVVTGQKVRIYGLQKYFTVEQGWRYGI